MLQKKRKENQKQQIKLKIRYYRTNNSRQSILLLYMYTNTLTNLYKQALQDKFNNRKYTS